MEEPTNPNAFFKALIDNSAPVGTRYQAVFELKHLNSREAIEAMIAAYPLCSDSVLLGHEILYALGQLEQQHAETVRQFLKKCVQNETENELCRHEAAEALSNYFFPQLEELYTRHLNSPCIQLARTCQISLRKILNNSLKQSYGEKFSGTKEPAAPFTDAEFAGFLKQYPEAQEAYESGHRVNTIEGTGYLNVLRLQSVPLFVKYRVMYYMRNKATKECVRALCLILAPQNSKNFNSLLKHQVCFILGQIGCEGSQDLIHACICNDSEEDIVRHQALAAVASQSKNLQFVRGFMNHPNRLIRESAAVAEHSIKYWNS